MSFLRRVFVVLTTWVLVACFSADGPVQDAWAHDGRVVRVGVYNNPPQVFVDDDGTAGGIYVDVLDEVARHEGWRLEFVPGSFAEGLERVRRGEIDLMTSIAATEERDKVVDFSEETVVTVWAQLYVRPDFTPRNILDMAGRRVAVMRSGVLGQKFGELCADFGIDCILTPVESYRAALEAIEAGTADAAVVNSLFGASHEREHAVRRSSIVFSPFKLQFAVPEGRNADLAAAVDRYLATWRADPGSVYYRILDRWLGVKPERTRVVPRWVWGALAGAAGLIGLFVLWSVALRRQMARRTAELRDSEARFRELFENMASGVAVYRPVDDGRDFVFTAFNRAGEAIDGVRREDLIGRRITECFPGVREMGLLDTLRRVGETGRVEILPQAWYQGGGQGGWRENRVFRLPTGEVVALYDDVSRRVEAEQELHRAREELERRVEDRTAELARSEALLREAQALTRIGNWEFDLASGRITWSDEMFRLFERSPDLGAPDFATLLDAFVPESRRRLLEKVERAVATGEGYDEDFTARLPNGQVRHFFTHGRAVRDANGSVIEMLGTAQDITERRQAEDALAVERDNLRNILRAMNDGVYIVDEEFNLQFTNPAIQRLFGPPEDRKCYEYLHGRVDVCPWCKNDEVFEGRSVRWEWHSHKVDRTFDLFDTPVRNPDGSVSKLEFFHDITERKKAEEALRRSNEELQQFAYVASHDLQEPLRMVSSFLQLLERRYGGTLDDQAREYIGYAVDGSRRMNQLIKDLLEFSRVGTRGGEPEPVDAHEVLEKALDNLRVALEDADAAVSCGEMPWVMADPGQLGQLMQNLIGNAIKYRAPDRPPVIRIEATRRDHEWEIAVSDNGIGIEPQYFDRIFMIFQRLHGRHEYQGTGIGLAICKKIVERHGGRLSVESTPGEGSTFRFTLPALAR